MIVSARKLLTHPLTLAKSPLLSWKKTRFVNPTYKHRNLKLSSPHLKHVQLCNQQFSSSRTVTLLNNMPLSRVTARYPIERMLGSDLRKATLWDSLTWLVWLSYYRCNQREFCTSYLMVLNLKAVRLAPFSLRSGAPRSGALPRHIHFTSVAPARLL